MNLYYNTPSENRVKLTNSQLGLKYAKYKALS